MLHYVIYSKILKHISKNIEIHAHNIYVSVHTYILVNKSNDTNIMCFLCQNIKQSTTQEIYCSNCTLITSIPHIEGLKKLDCCECSSITSIPHIQGLQKLCCSECPSIGNFTTDIPHIEGLRKLDCSNCPSITYIQHIKGLQI